MQIGHLSVLCQPKDRYSKKNGLESKLSWFHLHFETKSNIEKLRNYNLSN